MYGGNDRVLGEVISVLGVVPDDIGEDWPADSGECEVPCVFVLVWLGGSVGSERNGCSGAEN